MQHYDTCERYYFLAGDRLLQNSLLKPLEKCNAVGCIDSLFTCKPHAMRENP